MTVKKSRPLLFNLTHLWSSVSSTSRKRQNIIGQLKVIQFLLILKYFGGKTISSLKVSHNCFSLLKETSLNLSLQLACGSRPLCWHRERSDPHAVSCSFSFPSSSLNKAHSSACCQLFPWFLLPVMPLHLITFPRPEVPIVIFSVLLIVLNLCYLWETQNSSIGKESACNAGDPGLIPGFGKIPWRRERLPTPVFWPGEFYGLYSPWGHKESDTTERLSLTKESSVPFYNMQKSLRQPSNIASDIALLPRDHIALSKAKCRVC